MQRRVATALAGNTRRVVAARAAPLRIGTLARLAGVRAQSTGPAASAAVQPAQPAAATAPATPAEPVGAPAAPGGTPAGEEPPKKQLDPNRLSARIFDWIVDHPRLFFGGIVAFLLAWLVHSMHGNARREELVERLESESPLSAREVATICRSNGIPLHVFAAAAMLALDAAEETDFAHNRAAPPLTPEGLSLLLRHAVGAEALLSQLETVAAAMGEKAAATATATTASTTAAVVAATTAVDVPVEAVVQSFMRTALAAQAAVDAATAAAAAGAPPPPPPPPVVAASAGALPVEDPASPSSTVSLAVLNSTVGLLTSILGTGMAVAEGPLTASLVRHTRGVASPVQGARQMEQALAATASDASIAGAAAAAAATAPSQPAVAAAAAPPLSTASPVPAIFRRKLHQEHLLARAALLLQAKQAGGLWFGAVDALPVPAPRAAVAAAAAAAEPAGAASASTPGGAPCPRASAAAVASDLELSQQAEDAQQALAKSAYIGKGSIIEHFLAPQRYSTPLPDYKIRRPRIAVRASDARLAAAAAASPVAALKTPSPEGDGAGDASAAKEALATSVAAARSTVATGASDADARVDPLTLLSLYGLVVGARMPPPKQLTPEEIRAQHRPWWDVLVPVFAAEWVYGTPQEEDARRNAKAAAAAGVVTGGGATAPPAAAAAASPAASAAAAAAPAVGATGTVKTAVAMAPVEPAAAGTTAAAAAAASSSAAGSGSSTLTPEALAAAARTPVTAPLAPYTGDATPADRLRLYLHLVRAYRARVLRIDAAGAPLAAVPTGSEAAGSAAPSPLAAAAAAWCEAAMDRFTTGKPSTAAGAASGGGRSGGSKPAAAAAAPAAGAPQHEHAAYLRRVIYAVDAAKRAAKAGAPAAAVSGMTTTGTGTGGYYSPEELLDAIALLALTHQVSPLWRTHVVSSYPWEMHAVMSPERHLLDAVKEVGLQKDWKNSTGGAGKGAAPAPPPPPALPAAALGLSGALASWRASRKAIKRPSADEAAAVEALKRDAHRPGGWVSDQEAIRVMFSRGVCAWGECASRAMGSTPWLRPQAVAAPAAPTTIGGVPVPQQVSVGKF